MEGGIVMVTPKKHFEEVPLEIVRKILEAQIQPEETTKRVQETRQKSWKKNRHPRASTAGGERMN
jgi:hypothetical protein